MEVVVCCHNGWIHPCQSSPQWELGPLVRASVTESGQLAISLQPLCELRLISTGPLLLEPSYLYLHQLHIDSIIAMVRTASLLAAVAALTISAKAEGLYSKKSTVLQITGMDYDRLIAKSNYTSVSPHNVAFIYHALTIALDCRVSHLMVESSLYHSNQLQILCAMVRTLQEPPAGI